MPLAKDGLGFDSNKEEVVPKVDGVSLVDGVFDGAFGGDGEEDVVMREGVMRMLEWKPWKYDMKETRMIKRMQNAEDVAGSREGMVNCTDRKPEEFSQFFPFAVNHISS
ncbi:hypothetical protein Tco_0415054 [Tanacetum coccineum]